MLSQKRIEVLLQHKWFRGCLETIALNPRNLLKFQTLDMSLCSKITVNKPLSNIHQYWQVLFVSLFIYKTNHHLPNSNSLKSSRHMYLITWISLGFTFSDDWGRFTIYFIIHFCHTFYVMAGDLTTASWHDTKLRQWVAGSLTHEKFFNTLYNVNSISHRYDYKRGWVHTGIWTGNLPPIRMKRIKSLFDSFQFLLMIDIFLINVYCSNCKLLFLTNIFKLFLG